MLSRRDLLKYSGQTLLAAGCAPLAMAITEPNAVAGTHGLRCINVINFIRAVEPRFATDLLLPVQKQMELILAHQLPATWLLQFDALVSGPFVTYLKTHMAEGHEVGFWFEMNEMHCRAADVEWRGRPGYEWDSHPPVAFTIGYTHQERIKLADTAMETFKKVWGRYPSSVASWNLDSITVAHLSDHYGVDAFAVCRDQIATDGFTIWGAPIAGYYPSKTNCWSPALHRENQIGSPIFRMLGQDPVYYYQKDFSLPTGQRIGEPDTMEPVWTSGRSEEFIKGFLEMIAAAPTMKFGYAQLGQENSFSWPDMAEAYPKQMTALAQLREKGTVHVETMGDSGRRFKRAFATTPTQAQVQLTDPFGNTNPAQGSIWYQSRFYRANLHITGDLPFLRDITVYSDQNPQPFLDQATRSHEVEQRMPAILDGYHWRKEPKPMEPGAGGFFMLGDKRLRLKGKPKITETGNTLQVVLACTDGSTLSIHFEEESIVVSIKPATTERLSLSLEWDPAKSSLANVQPKRAEYVWQEFRYGVSADSATLEQTSGGWSATASGKSFRLNLAQ